MVYVSPEWRAALAAVLLCFLHRSTSHACNTALPHHLRPFAAQEVSSFVSYGRLHPPPPRSPTTKSQAVPKRTEMKNHIAKDRRTETRILRQIHDV